DRIISEARSLSQRMEMYWFSGSYSGTFPGDPVNEFAVRQHWLVDPVTFGDPKNFRLVPKAEHFLVDLAEIGATQIVPPPKNVEPTEAAKKLIAARGKSKARQSPQVISGAGLVASHHAIWRLPPFMNAKAMVVWIDDHLKRLLHEAIGDLDPSDVERLHDAVLRQDRYPKGITSGEIA